MYLKINEKGRVVEITENPTTEKGYTSQYTTWDKDMIDTHYILKRNKHVLAVKKEHIDKVKNEETKNLFRGDE